MAEQLESIQGNLPVPQARWLRARAELHGCSLSAELRRVVFLAMQVENLVGTAGADIHFVSAPLPPAA
jgi:plasmid stability protein